MDKFYLFKIGIRVHWRAGTLFPAVFAINRRCWAPASTNSTNFSKLSEPKHLPRELEIPSALGSGPPETRASVCPKHVCKLYTCYVSSPAVLNLCKTLNCSSSETFQETGRLASAMTIYGSLKALIINPRSSQAFVTAATASLAVHPLAYPLYQPLFRLSSQSSRPPPAFSNWIVPFQGPLFLSCPPWKLSQSATPLYLQGNGAVLRKIEALNLKLLRMRTMPPPQLELASVPSGEAVLQRVGAEDSGDCLVESLINLPNLISMSRLISGPVLGWYDSLLYPRSKLILLSLFVNFY